MDKLANDPEILSKIPLLLQRKLPLNECETNEQISQSKIENYDQSKRVNTIGEVNPFQMDDNDKIMETMGDFEPLDTDKNKNEEDKNKRN